MGLETINKYFMKNPAENNYFKNKNAIQTGQLRQSVTG